MTFESIVDDRIVKIRETLKTKAKEYASTKSRFHTFEVGGRIMDVTPEQALQGMMLKHIVSVFDLINWTETDDERITNELIDEKIGDMINYLILLEGMLKQRTSAKLIEQEYKTAIDEAGGRK